MTLSFPGKLTKLFFFFFFAAVERTLEITYTAS